jgi:hypothetical protein
MSQCQPKSICHAVRTLLTATIVASLAFAAGPVLASKPTQPDRVETRITNIHAQLRITPAQEEQWGKIVEVMRDNAKKMADLTSARQASTKTMNAVDDLKSYGEIAQAHADAIKNLTPAFAALYASMSDAQKAEADEMFRKGISRAGTHAPKQKTPK